MKEGVGALRTLGRFWWGCQKWLSHGTNEPFVFGRPMKKKNLTWEELVAHEGSWLRKTITRLDEVGTPNTFDVGASLGMNEREMKKREGWRSGEGERRQAKRER